MKKGQALLLVFFIFIVIGIVTGSLVVMWKAEVNSRVLERDSLAAFYLAQAGLEMAKMTLWYYAYYQGYLWYWYYWAGYTNPNFGGGSYTVTVYPTGYWAPTKTLISIGTYGNSQRKIKVDMSYASFLFQPWTWQEQ